MCFLPNLRSRCAWNPLNISTYMFFMIAFAPYPHSPSKIVSFSMY